MKKKLSESPTKPEVPLQKEIDEDILFLIKKRKDENEALKKILLNLNTSSTKINEQKDK
jgi:hypothetical protein